MLIFAGGRKIRREPGETPSEQGENQQQTHPAYGTELASNPGHIGGRRALSPLRHPARPKTKKINGKRDI